MQDTARSDTDNKNKIYLNAIVNVHKKYINKFNINYLRAYDIED